MGADTFFIGIAGGTGAGKSTAIKNITQVLDKNDYALLYHDHYYKDQSHIPQTERGNLNFDHPSALETDLLVKHLKQLKKGKQIEQPQYDFVTHTRKKETKTIHPARVIIVDGILLFENKELRDNLDLKIFVDTPSDIRFIRRLQRDIATRGRDMESVIEQYETTVRPMHLEFVEPTKRFADVIMPEGGQNWVALDLVLARIQSVVGE